MASVALGLFLLLLASSFVLNWWNEDAADSSAGVTRVINGHPQNGQSNARMAWSTQNTNMVNGYGGTHSPMTGEVGKRETPKWVSQIKNLEQNSKGIQTN